MADVNEPEIVEFSVSDPSEFRRVRQQLERIPDLRLDVRHVNPAPGELGGWDVLQGAIDSGPMWVAVGIAVKALPEIIRSLKPGITLTVKHGQERWDITAPDADAAVKAIEAVRAERS